VRNDLKPWNGNKYAGYLDQQHKAPIERLRKLSSGRFPPGSLLNVSGAPAVQEKLARVRPDT